MTSSTSSTPPATKFERSQNVITARALGVRERYAETSSQWCNFLIYGDFGTGKTQTLATAPKPIFIDSFDPGGTKTAALQPLIESGDIIVENKWETDSWKKPFAFREWEKEIEARKKDDFFSHIGTYALDSVTKWADSMMFAILKSGTAGTSRVGKTPEQQDYLAQQFTSVDWLGVLMGLPCHVIVTGHIGLTRDEVTGGMESGLMLAGKNSEKVPLVFDEKYVTRTITKSSGTTYELLVKNEGRYKAETRIGGIKFNPIEEPNIKALLKKAGKSWEDRPSLFSSS